MKTTEQPLTEHQRLVARVAAALRLQPVLKEPHEQAAAVATWLEKHPVEGAVFDRLGLNTFDGEIAFAREVAAEAWSSTPTDANRAEIVRSSLSATLCQLERLGASRKIEGRWVVLVPTWSVDAMLTWMKEALQALEK